MGPTSAPSRWLVGSWAAVVAFTASMAACGNEPTTKIDVTQLFGQISPPPGTIMRCQSVQLTLSMVDQLSRVIVPDSVQWSSSDAASASVSSTGVMHALKATPAVTITGVGFAHGLAKSTAAVWIVSDPAAGVPASCP